MGASTRAPWLQPFRLLCWLAKQNFSVARCCKLGAPRSVLSFLLATCKILARHLNLGRPKRGLRRARESSELRRDSFWRGRCIRVCARLPRGHPPRATAGGTRPETTGATQRSHTATSQAAGKPPDTSTRNTRPRSSSTKKVSGAARASPSTPTCKRTVASQQAQAIYPTRSVFCKTNARIRSPDSLSLKRTLRAMKIARLLSTSTRKAGHTPRLPPPTRDVAAEAN